jgi:arylsulfatase A
LNDYVCDFIDRHKEEPFFIYYPMLLPHGPFLPTPDSADRSSTSNQQNYEDMVAYVDKLVGRVVDKLDEVGVRDNTLILFTGDNGTPGGKKGGIKSELNGRIIEGGKSLTTDAGTRVALVANMLGTVAPGIVSDDLVDFSDMMPTIAAMTGASLPAGEVLDGVSFAPQLRGEKGTPREWIYCYYEPVPGPETKPTIFARDQRWKLYSDGRLFDISNDVLEMNPISDGGPARVKLQAALDSMPSEGAKIYRPEK